VIDAADIVAIQQVLALYGHVADAVVGGGDPDRLLEVFAVDATIDRRAAHGVLHRGIGEIQELFVGRDAPHPPSHQGMNAYVWEEDGVVRAVSKWLVIEPRTGGMRSGDYTDVFRRTENGWRVAERVVRVRWWDGPVEPSQPY
jgi:hypothetical protein